MSWPDVIAPRPLEPYAPTLHRVPWPEGEEQAGPISLSDAQAYARITETAEDTTAAMILAGAIDAAENTTRRAVALSLWDLVLDSFPASGVIHLRRPPVVEVVELQHRDADDEWVVISALDYEVSIDGDRATVAPLIGESWPSVSGELRSVRLRYRAGYRPHDYAASVYEATPPLIPALLKATICELFTFRFDTRGRGSDNRLIEVSVPSAIEAALWAERVEL